MRIEQASDLLAKMYTEEVGGGKAISVHLFAIKYADELRGMPLKRLVEGAGVPSSYATEVRKGINLAKCVEIRQV